MLFRDIRLVPWSSVADSGGVAMSRSYWLGIVTPWTKPNVSQLGELQNGFPNKSRK